jgi:hypothetical protein
MFPLANDEKSVILGPERACFLALMYCPRCKAEYRPGFTHGAECDVELVHELNEEALTIRAPVVPGEPDQDPFCEFWRGDDPRLYSEFCERLDQEGIPHKTVRHEDRLFRIGDSSSFQIGIPYSLFEKAEAAVQAAFASDEDDLPEATDEEPSPLELPDSIAPDDSRQDWDSANWFPEDATVEMGPANIGILERSSKWPYGKIRFKRASRRETKETPFTFCLGTKFAQAKSRGR